MFLYQSRGDAMNDYDRVLLVYRYFFYNETYYDNKVNMVFNTCKMKNATIDDYYRLIRAKIEQETFNKIMTDILTLFNPKHF